MSASGVALEKTGHGNAAPRSLPRIAVLAILAILVVFAGERWMALSDNANANRGPLAVGPAFGPKTYEQALADNSARLAAKKELAATFPGDWLRMEAVAYAYADRFRLTGDYADLAKAQEIVEAARRTVAPPAGPILADAEIAMVGHRIEDAAKALADFSTAVAPESAETTAAAAIVGDIAFYRGNIAAAVARYRAAKPAGMRDRLAILAKAQGRFDDAAAEQRSAVAERRRLSHFALATLALRAGAIELARGDKASARILFEQADQQFAGHWLVEAHLAQADALDGRIGEAITSMRKVAEKSGSAEAMDALAVLLRSEGRADESRRWAAKAGEAWRRRIELAPEAAWGHAIEHELVFGSRATALELARRNFANRPFGESRILLASALMANGRIREAITQIRAAASSGWRSASMYALLSALHELEGDSVASDMARQDALALNPSVFEPWTPLVWFSHG